MNNKLKQSNFLIDKNAFIDSYFIFFITCGIAIVCFHFFADSFIELKYIFLLVITGVFYANLVDYVKFFLKRISFLSSFEQFPYSISIWLAIIILIIASFLPIHIGFTGLSTYIIFILFKNMNIIKLINLRISSILILIFSGMLVAIKILSFNFISFEYLPRLVLSGLHLDQLYHSAISNMYLTYGAKSTGLDGIVQHDIYTLGENIIGLVSVLVTRDMLEFYNYGIILFILPLFLITSMAAFRDAKLLLKGNDEEDNTGGIWTAFFSFSITFTLLPGEMWQRLGLSPIPGLNSESNLIGLMILMPILVLLLKLSSKDISKWGYFSVGIFLILLLFVLSKIKAPLVAVLSPGVFIFFCFQIFFQKANKNHSLFLALCSLLPLVEIINIASMVQVGGDHSDIQKFLYFHRAYIGGMWPLLIAALTSNMVLLCIFIATKPKENDVFFNGELFPGGRSYAIFIWWSCLALPLTGLIWRVGSHYGSIEYFFDASFIITFFAFFVYVRTLPESTFAVFFQIWRKSYLTPIICIFGLLMISYKSFDISLSYRNIYHNLIMVSRQALVLGKPEINCPKSKNEITQVLKLSFGTIENIICSLEMRNESRLRIMKNWIFSDSSLNVNPQVAEIKHLILQLVELRDNLTTSEKQKSFIFIDNSYDIARNHSANWYPKQLCDPFPFLVPAITSVANLRAISSPQCDGSYSYLNYNNDLIKHPFNKIDIKENELCERAKKFGIYKVIVVSKSIAARYVYCN